ncbi:hypothetical protein IGI04_037839 [Brassica rapa subsp. trilocularis]|uniref:FBD domain-containing protein n=1 Tax=Brassica rapa subsp. trilocularis TaxID=1813537 RepID=A0ABQ7LLK3_BRACM|nr:hypothetical protein IGI04_037839 [Brassica rapa subsp. trilocularis]
MPVFNNLKSLRIKSDKKRGWQAMPVLLRNCPRLDILGLLHHVTDKCGDACDCNIFGKTKEMEIFVEENEPTELRVPEVAMLIPQMIEVYNSLSSCNVQLLVSDYLSKKWAAKGRL